jgi:hypothetical protein
MTGDEAANNHPSGVGADSTEVPGEIAGLPPPSRLPAVLPPDRRRRPRRRLGRCWLLVPLLSAAAAIGYWWFSSQPALPPGIVFGNGRLEARRDRHRHEIRRAHYQSVC